MTLPSFSYHAPQGLDEAINLLQSLGGETRLMAGGTDLLPRMRAGKTGCEHLVALKGIPELDGVSYDDQSGLTIGANTVLAEVAALDAAREHYPMLCHAIDHLATVQVRHKATLTGNLCNASPCADTAPPVMALGGMALIAGPAGRREMPVEDLLTGPGTNALNDAEILVAVRIPPPPRGRRTEFIKHSPRSKVDISAVSVMVAMLLVDGIATEVDIFLGTVGPTPMRARNAENVLRGRALTAELIEEAARAAQTDCSPITDFRATEEYKTRMVHVLTRRALQNTGRLS